MRRLYMIILGSVMAGASLGGAVPDYYDTFDDLYGNGYTFDQPSNGWQASSSAAMITNNGAYSANNAVFMQDGVALTNTLGADANLKIWTDLRIKPQLGGDSAASPLTNLSSFLCYFDTSGYVVAGTPTGWIVCSNDIWGNHVPLVSNDYVRLTVFQDFNTSTQALMLNGQLLLQDVKFPGAVSSLARMVFVNTISNCWLDNVWAKTNSGPDGLVSDRNGNGAYDALELQQYGYAGRTQYVGAVGYLTHTNIQAAVNDWRLLDIVYVSAGAYTGDVLVLNAIPFAGGAFTNIGSLTIRTESNPVFRSSMKWSSITLDTNSVATFSNTVSCSNLTLGANAQLTLAAGQSLSATAVTVTGLVSVAAGATTTVSTALSLPAGGHMDFTAATFLYTPLAVNMSGTFSLSNNWGQGNSFTISPGASCTFHQALTNPPLTNLTVGANASVTFSQPVACSNLVVEAGATVTLAEGATLQALNVVGTLIVGAGKTVTVNTATLSGTLQVTGSGTLSVGASLSLTGAGQIEFTSSRLIYPAGNVDMTGTFTLDAATLGTAATLPLPFADDFEMYANNTVITNLGFRGWGASDGTVKVQNSVKNAGSKAVEIPVGSVLSNRVASGAATKVWGDFYLQPSPGAEPLASSTNGQSFLAYVNTNGILVVAVSGGWVVCSNQFGGDPAPVLQSNAFSRITVFQNLETHKFAVFVDGILVAQMLTGPVSLDALSSFKVNNDSADDTAYLDDVLITTTVPSGMADLNLNNISDAVEINDTDRLDYAEGCVFLIR